MNKKVIEMVHKNIVATFTLVLLEMFKQFFLKYVEALTDLKSQERFT